ncbi:Di-sulfide bridge nucleocytoplasmic transport domain-containing protein [Gongronella butleri]|nr:Di-sulfide bridge nucleocytoplasmic transport domain-containing protein [Gongronella butleri]
MPQPHQKLFSFGSDPSTWSAAVLTRRYQQNAKEAKERARAQAHQTQLTPSSVHLTPPPPPPSDIVPANLSTYFYHRSVSLTIMSYVRLIFTVSLLSILFYVVSQLIWTLKHDLQAKAEEHTRDLVHEIRVCAYNYKENLCDPGTRLPAMEDLCQKWLACMNQLPTTVTR